MLGHQQGGLQERLAHIPYRARSSRHGRADRGEMQKTCRVFEANAHVSSLQVFLVSESFIFAHVNKKLRLFYLLEY